MSDQIEHSEHIISKKTYFVIFAALMVLLFITWGVAYVNLGIFNVYVALTIAVIKAMLVVLYFMHVRYGSKLVWVVAGAGFVWLLLLFGLTLADYVSRPWLPVRGK
jgi:cytochrome c oxidase subunit 4